MTTTSARNMAPVRNQEPAVSEVKRGFKVVQLETEGPIGKNLKKPDFPLMGDGTGGPTPRCSW